VGRQVPYVAGCPEPNVHWPVSDRISSSRMLHWQSYAIHAAHGSRKLVWIGRADPGTFSEIITSQGNIDPASR